MNFILLVACLALIINGVLAIPFSIIEKDEGATSFYPALCEDFALMAYGGSVGQFVIAVRDEFGRFKNRTSGGIWDVLGDYASQSTLPNTPGSVGFKQCWENEILFQWYDTVSTDYQYMRITYDPDTNTFGTPKWSSVFAEAVAEAVSSDLNKIVENTYSNPSTTLTTYLWNGNDYVLAGSFVIANTFLSNHNIYIGENVMMVGHTGYTGCSGCAQGVRQGRALLYNWNSGNGHWDTTPEHEFVCPTVSVQEECVNFGNNVWVSEDKTKAFVSVISAQKYDSKPQSGAYVYFTDTGSGWNTPSQTFPDQNAVSSYQCGRIFGKPNKNGAFFYQSRTNWIGAVTPNGLMTVVKQPYGIGTSSRPTSGASWYSYGSGYAALYLTSGAIAGTDMSTHDTGFIVYTLRPEEMYFPSSVKTINPPTTDANHYFGRFVDIAGDYAVTCSTFLVHEDSGTTQGTIFVYKKNLQTGEYDFVDSIGPGSQAETNIGFCNDDLAFDGSTIVVSALSEDIGGTSNRGAVYVYDFDGSTITFNTKITAPENEANQQFGDNLAINGNTLVIGAPYVDKDGFTNRGVTYVSTKTVSTWGSLQELHKPIENPLDASDYYGRDLDTDGTRIIVCSNQQGGSGYQKGVGVIYTHNGTGWEIEDEIKGVTDGANFGQSCGISGEWAFLSSSYAEISMYKLNGATWDHFEHIENPEIPSGDGSTAVSVNRLHLEGNILVQGRYAEVYKCGTNNDGAVGVYHFDGTSWFNDDRRLYTNPNKECGVDISQVANTVNTDGSSIVWSNYNYNNGVNFIGRMFAHTIFITCTSSSQCESTQYCDPNDACVAQKACTEHADCIGELRSGRLPYCDKTAGFCKDSYAGTCTSATSCNTKHKKLKAVQTKLGSITQNVATGGNITKAREVAIRLYQDLKADNTGLTQNLTTFISGTESANFPSQLFETYNDDASLLNAIKNLVCPPEVRDLCDITQDSRRRLMEMRSGRRSLQSSGAITVEITYEIDSDLYDNMVNNATTFADGSAFEQALADQLGLSTDNVTITAVYGQLIIEYIVSQEAEGNDPLSEENLQALQDVSDSLDSITSTVVSELGLGSNDIQTQGIDYCEGRDCNGRGTCDVDTGICACDSPEYWGINCETLVDCGSGERANATAYCICEYPEYGQRCQYTKDCSC